MNSCNYLCICTQALLTLTLKIGDCLSIALNQDPQAFSCVQADLGIMVPYCSSLPMGTRCLFLLQVPGCAWGASQPPSWGLVANKGDLQVLVVLYMCRRGAHFYVADIDALE